MSESRRKPASLLGELHRLLWRWQASGEDHVDVTVTDLVLRSGRRSADKGALAEARAAMLTELWREDVIVEQDWRWGGRVLTVRYKLPRPRPAGPPGSGR